MDLNPFFRDGSEAERDRFFLWSLFLAVRGVKDEAPIYEVRFLHLFLIDHKELKKYKGPKHLSVLQFLTSCGI